MDGGDYAFSISNSKSVPCNFPLPTIFRRQEQKGEESSIRHYTETQKSVQDSKQFECSMEAYLLGQGKETDKESQCNKKKRVTRKYREAETNF